MISLITSQRISCIVFSKPEEPRGLRRREAFRVKSSDLPLRTYNLRKSYEAERLGREIPSRDSNSPKTNKYGLVYKEIERPNKAVSTGIKSIYSEENEPPKKPKRSPWLQERQSGVAENVYSHLGQPRLSELSGLSDYDTLYPIPKNNRTERFSVGHHDESVYEEIERPNKAVSTGIKPIYSDKRPLPPIPHSNRTERFSVGHHDENVYGEMSPIHAKENKQPKKFETKSSEYREEPIYATVNKQPKVPERTSSLGAGQIKAGRNEEEARELESYYTKELPLPPQKGRIASKINRAKKAIRGWTEKQKERKSNKRGDEGRTTWYL